jgi:hypothetical protein
MTSQSGTFSAMLIRQQTNAAVGGLGTDFCYVDVINTVARQSVWESPCEPITTTNPCIVLLSDNGLEIMDGNNKDVWNNGASNNYQSLVLLENGALQLVDKKGQTVWSSTDHPRVNQNCGTVLQPGSSPFINPPFASPLQAQLPNGQPVFTQPFTTANPIVGSAPPQIMRMSSCKLRALMTCELLESKSLYLNSCTQRCQLAIIGCIIRIYKFDNYA